MHRRSSLLICLALAACQQAAPPAEPAVAPPPAASTSVPPNAIKPEREHKFVAAITAEDLAQHIKTIASDEFEGRGPGTLGERVTTTYLKGEFERLGLQPGNNGSYFQSVPMQITSVDPASSLNLSIGAQQLAPNLGEDVVLSTRTGQPEIRIDGSEMVFVGYGVNAPEQNWNDYAGLDVKGKTVVALVNDPGFLRDDPELFRGKAMTYYGRWTYKFEEAARQGAVGCLLIHDTAAAAYGWDVVKSSWAGKRYDLPPSEDAEPRLKFQGWLSDGAAKKLFVAAGLDLEKQKLAADTRGFHPVPLNATASVNLKSEIRSSSSDNVVALLPGSGKPDQAVVYSAHWDHLGKHDAEAGDNIYNGAIDNATGVAAVLEIAEAFVHQDPKPLRSVLFFIPTLEESSLLGSRYYVSHPTIPIANTVAEINMDALPVRGRTEDIDVIGGGQSDLEDALAEAAKLQDRHLVPEERPQDGSYFRSDQFNFVRKGVPSLYAHAGYAVRGKGEAFGRANAEEYTRLRYHKPADEFDPGWDLSGTVEDVQAFYAVGQKVAAGDYTPQFRADSEFRSAREDAGKKTAAKK